LIIGKLSIDPRRVLASIVTYDRGKWILAVKLQISDGLMELEDYFDSEACALDWQEQLDGHCYKGTLADAISSKDVDDGDIDDLTITDKLILGMDK